MADMKRFQVQSACVLLPLPGPDGMVMRTVYRGAVVEADPTQLRVKHNVESGYITELDSGATPGVDAFGGPMTDDKLTVEDRQPGEPPARFDPASFVSPPEPAKPVQETPAEAKPSVDAEVQAKRDAARAKLPADGSAPDGRAAQEVWAEYAVSKGYDPTQVESASRDEIKALFKG